MNSFAILLEFQSKIIRVRSVQYHTLLKLACYEEDESRHAATTVSIRIGYPKGDGIFL